MTSKRSREISWVAAVVAALLLTSPVTSLASAASGSPAPAGSLTLTIKPAPSFRLDASGDVADVCGFGQPFVYSSAKVLLGYQATAPSGISGYDITPLDGVSGPQHFSVHVPLAWFATNYDGTCGGGSALQYGWRITAFDNAGQSITREEGYRFFVIRWSNANTTGDRWVFSPGWSVSTCACADGGSENFTNGKGRWGSYLAATTDGEHLGLMMAKGPARGRANVYLDGVLKRTIDTYSVGTRNRVYVWDSGPLTMGQHTVKVVNLATPGRSRIDINAMGILTGIVSP